MFWRSAPCFGSTMEDPLIIMGILVSRKVKGFEVTVPTHLIAVNAP